METRDSAQLSSTDQKAAKRRESDAARPGCADESSPAAAGWLRLFLGRQVLRLCSKGSAVEICDGCGLRPLCKCATDQIAEAQAIERRVWVALSVAGGAVILYAVISFVQRS